MSFDEQRAWCRPWFPLSIDLQSEDGRRESVYQVIDYFLEFSRGALDRRRRKLRALIQRHREDAR